MGTSFWRLAPWDWIAGRCRVLTTLVLIGSSSQERRSSRTSSAAWATQNPMQLTRVVLASPSRKLGGSNSCKIASLQEVVCVATYAYDHSYHRRSSRADEIRPDYALPVSFASGRMQNRRVTHREGGRALGRSCSLWHVWCMSHVVRSRPQRRLCVAVPFLRAFYQG